MLTISNLIFASIIHVPNVNTTVAYSAGGGFPTPITLTVNATDIEFTYDDFMGIKAQNWNSPTGAEKWKFETKGDIVSSPAVENGMVFIGSWDNCIYAIE